jgi:hypothetical protein
MDCDPKLNPGPLSSVPLAMVSKETGDALAALLLESPSLGEPATCRPSAFMPARSALFAQLSPREFTFSSIFAHDTPHLQPNPMLRVRSCRVR